MLPTQLLWLCNPVAHAFLVPALCKVRGTHYVFGASEAGGPLKPGFGLSGEWNSFRRSATGL
jgi:hypothetical protein